MLDSRHAPRYLRWFDGIALLGGSATLIILMAMLAAGFSPDKRENQKSSHQRSRPDEGRYFIGSYVHSADEQKEEIERSW
jgi:hypothetical protein